MQKVILYGPECLEAEKFYYQNREKYNFIYCISEDKNACFHSVPVYPFSEERVLHRDALLLICVGGGESYNRTALLLRELGLKELTDFMPLECVDKKLALIHGNCYMNVIVKYLQNVKAFTERFFLYDIPRICMNKKGYIEPELLERCELFIYQHISTKQYGERLCDDYLLRVLPERCMKIAVPNFAGLASLFFPCTGGGDKVINPLIGGRDGQGLFPYEDYRLNQCITEGMDTEEIIQRAGQDDWISEEKMVSAFHCSIRQLEKKEQEWDIKIVDFIKETYRRERLFYNHNHPTNATLREICRRLLQMAGIQDSNGLDKEIDITLDTYEVPVFPCVKNFWKLEWGGSDEIIRKNGRCLSDAGMNLREYIAQYVYWRKYGMALRDKGKE